MTLRLVSERGGPAPAISVVVPVLNGGARLVELARAVARQRVPGEVELLLADSGSTDGAIERAHAAGPEAGRCFAVEGPYDHGRVRSALVLEARAPLVALFSQDAVPQGDEMLCALAKAFEDPTVAGAMARQVPRPGADPLVVGTLQRWTPSGQAIRIRRLPPGADSLPPTERMRLARFDNVASMVRRERVAELPFPSRPFGEDLAWGWAALEAGWALAYVPQAEVEHHHDPSLSELYERNRLSHAQARAEFGLQAVPGPVAGALALALGVPDDLRDGGLRWVGPGLLRRGASLLGQWRGGR